MSNEDGKFIVLCAPTARSQAYLQAIQFTNLIPSHVIVYGCSEDRNTAQVQSQQPAVLGAFTPDFSISIQQTIDECMWDATYIDNDDIGGKELNKLLNELAPKLTIFSGFGGQIVPTQTLNSSGQLLHIHSGWLPDYRGSTTIYYSLLNENRCAASALLLTENIDDGPILARKHYQAPTKTTDIDYLYDCSIRADLLVSVLTDYVMTMALPKKIDKDSEGEMYFVVHPLLKHLAILSLND
ncbi:MAG: methionyl-tRNA formyltransferase [Piscirickettsiaceae bacterium]|nr:methionyl-tRNA formyltransferase [Piscirickettsiaceae bacterium]